MRNQKHHLPSEEEKFWCNIFLQNSKFTVIFSSLLLRM